MKYNKLVEIYSKLESTSKRLDKTYNISEFLKITKEDDLDMILLLLQGSIYPKYDQRKIGVASKLVLKALTVSTGIENVEKEWYKTGDLGKSAENLVKRKKQATLFSTELTVKKVFQNIRKLAELEGKGSVDEKIKLIAELLTSAEPQEARYIVRMILEDLRVGVGDGSIRDAIVWAYFGEKLEIKLDQKKNKVEIKDRDEYNKYVETVQEAYDISNNFGIVAKICNKDGLKGLSNIKLEPLRPIKVMLYQKAASMEDAFERVGTPAALEFKYDGFRLQIHKDNDKIKLFTRRLEEVTPQFPDVVKVIKEHVSAKSFIIDSEVIGIDKKTKKYLPFQSISQRIRRKYDIDDIVKKVPVIVNIFDAMQIEGKNVLKSPFKDRRSMLTKIVKEDSTKICLAQQVILSDVEKAGEFYNKALDLGNEGVMVKSLEAPYKPGSRVGYGVKVKPIMETLDLVIVGAERGHGKRAGWLTSFIIACKDDETGELLEIGKVGTGFKEKGEEDLTFEQLSDILKPLIINDKDSVIKIKPQIVIEISYEEIQKSTTYSSEYALRFPRLVKLRDEKAVDDINTISDVEDLYFMQRGRG